MSDELQDATIPDTGEIVESLGQESNNEEPFWTYQPDQGEPMVFKTKDELHKAWKNSGLMQSDYTRKMQGLSSERQKWEQERTEQQKRFEELKKIYDPLDNLFKTKPAVKQQIMKLIQSPQSPNDQAAGMQQMIQQAMKPMMERLEKFEQTQAQKEYQKAKEAKLQALKEADPDFDFDQIDTQMRTFNAEDPAALYDLFYRASKGMVDPAKLEEKQAIERTKKLGSLPPSSTGKQKPGESKTFKSLDDAAEAAIQEMSGQ